MGVLTSKQKHEERRREEQPETTKKEKSKSPKSSKSPSTGHTDNQYINILKAKRQVAPPHRRPQRAMVTGTTDPAGEFGTTNGDLGDRKGLVKVKALPCAIALPSATSSHNSPVSKPAEARKSPTPQFGNVSQCNSPQTAPKAAEAAFDKHSSAERVHTDTPPRSCSPQKRNCVSTNDGLAQEVEIRTNVAKATRAASYHSHLVSGDSVKPPGSPKTTTFNQTSSDTDCSGEKIVSEQNCEHVSESVANGIN